MQGRGRVSLSSQNVSFPFLFVFSGHGDRGLKRTSAVERSLAAAICVQRAPALKRTHAFSSARLCWTVGRPLRLSYLGQLGDETARVSSRPFSSVEHKKVRCAARPRYCAPSLPMKHHVFVDVFPEQTTIAVQLTDTNGVDIIISMNTTH